MSENCKVTVLLAFTDATVYMKIQTVLDIIEAVWKFVFRGLVQMNGYQI